MTSKISILVGQGVNQEVAEKNNIKITEVDGNTRLQTHAVVDSGTNTNCTDSSLRKCLGTDKLPDAARGLKGATRRTNNVSTNKLRIVTMDTEVTVMEARSISDLGYSGPNSDIFLGSVKREIEVSNKNKEHFDFAQKGITPRMLIGLKNGNLLGRQVSEHQMVDLGIRTLWLSPNLQIWRTPVNSKLLITGSLGIDPLLVEESINYPRSKLLVKEEIMKEEILKEIKKELKDLETTLKATFSLTEQEALPMKSLQVSEDQATVEQDEIQQERNTADKNSPPTHIRSLDKILLFGDDILVLPADVEGEDVAEDDENVCYTKADSRRLERYLQQEAMSEWKRPEKKCTQHLVMCEVCELLSKDTSN